jgi:hypothetical protein
MFYLRELYKETGLSKLKDIKKLFKMQNDLTPASLSTLTPSRFHDVHTYNTRYFNAFPFLLYTNVRLENYFSYEDERVIFVSVLDRNNNI